MKAGQIQLGVRRSSGKSLDRFSAQGFFYGERRGRKRIHEASPEKIKATGLRTVYGYVVADIFPARQHLIFYDNPSRKRDARCTNIPHTGAILQVWARVQRLRKGFQENQRGSVGGKERLRLELEAVSKRYRTTIPQALSVTFFASSMFLESLSSAAEIRHIGEEYEVTRDSPCPCLNS